MDPTLVPAVVLLTIVVALLVSLRDPPAFLRQLREQLDQLGHELDRRIDRERWARRLPVFSAQTIHGKEAEFIRQRLPRKAPRARFVLLLFLIGVFAWWFARQLG
jgi:hypothetical protein